MILQMQVCLSSQDMSVFIAQITGAVAKTSNLALVNEEFL